MAFTLGRQASEARDFEVPSPPSDGVSSIVFSPNSQLLLSGSWDQSVRCWQLQRNAIGKGAVSQAIPAAETKLQGPILCTDFIHDGSTVFAGGGDRTVMMWQLSQAGAPPVQVGVHNNAVMFCKWLAPLNLLLTGSWDKTVKVWDARSPQPVSTTQLSEAPLAMDVLHPLMVVATGDQDRTVFTYNLQSGQPQAYAKKQSQLKFQTRCVTCWKDQNGTPEGYAMGSIEGRVSLDHVSELLSPPAPGSKKSFAFRCHRVDKGPMGGQIRATTSVYAVNSIAFHPYGTFATAGADGGFNFWDKDNRQRLKEFPKRTTAAGQTNTISTATFSPDGELYGYALSYDWSKGVEGALSTDCNAILIHHVTDEEIKQKDKKK